MKLNFAEFLNEYMRRRKQYFYQHKQYFISLKVNKTQILASRLKFNFSFWQNFNSWRDREKIRKIFYIQGGRSYVRGRFNSRLISS